MATFPSSSCVQLREIPRGDRVKTCACLMLQFKTFGFPEPFSQLGLEVICPLWAWAGVWSTACGVAGSGDHCVPGIQVQRGGCVCAEQGITSPEQSLTYLFYHTCTQNTLSQQSFQSLTCGSLWIQIFLISAVICAGVRVGVGGCHCWHSAQCGCCCNTHRDLEQFSLLRMLAFKNVTGTLRLAVRGAWFGIKLWLSVISYNLQMAWLAEMLKTVRSHFYSFIN